MTAHEPVSELVFTVQFPQIAGMTVLDVCALYERLRDRFPNVQHAPRLPPIQPNPAPPQQLVMFDPGLQIPRTWMIASDGHRVVQVQDDRLSFNWRRMGALEYPSYDKLKFEFAEIVRDARAWHEARFSGVQFAPELCELHYQNQIPLRTEKGEKKLFEVFAFQREIKRKIAGYATSWFELPPDGEKGYTTVSIGVGVLPDGLPVTVLNISAITPISVGAAPETWFNTAHGRALDIFRSIVIPSE